MITRFALSLCLTMLLFALLAAPLAQAHEGHDHGAPPPPVTATIAPRAEASSADFDLVVIARGTRLQLFLDTFRGNEPVEAAEIEVDGPAGTAKAVTAAGGYYALDAPWLARSGSYDLAFTVKARGVVDILTATLVIPETASTSGKATGRWAALLGLSDKPDASARLRVQDAPWWVVSGASFLAGLIAAMLFLKRKVAASLAGIVAVLGVMNPSHVSAGPTVAVSAVTERDVAQRFADGSIFVPKATQRILAIRTLFTEIGNFTGTVELPARVIPDPNTTGFVQASVAGRLAPPPGGFPRLGSRVETGDVLALVQPAIGAADVTSQQQQARELDQQISLSERRLERFRQIQGVIARAQIEDAELELQGLRIRRSNLDRGPREPERLLAPLPGVVAAVQAVAGQIAEPNTIIFQIVDPSRFWVEALSFEPHAIGGTANGRFADGRSVPLVYRGSGLAERNQAIPIQFSVEGSVRGLRAGQLLTVLAATSEARSGIAVPRTSVLRGQNGQSIVYEQTNAERFLPREVRVEPLDGTHVLIVSGVESGKRIVTQGAELLNQIR